MKKTDIGQPKASKSFDDHELQILVEENSSFTDLQYQQTYKFGINNYGQPDFQKRQEKFSEFEQYLQINRKKRDKLKKQQIKTQPIGLMKFQQRKYLPKTLKVILLVIMASAFVLRYLVLFQNDIFDQNNSIVSNKIGFQSQNQGRKTDRITNAIDLDNSFLKQDEQTQTYLNSNNSPKLETTDLQNQEMEKSSSTQKKENQININLNDQQNIDINSKEQSNLNQNQNQVEFKQFNQKEINVIQPPLTQQQDVRKDDKNEESKDIKQQQKNKDYTSFFSEYPIQNEVEIKQEPINVNFNFNSEKKIQQNQLPDSQEDIRNKRFVEESSEMYQSAECRIYIHDLLRQKGRLYDFRISHDLFRAISQADSFPGSILYDVNKQQYIEGVQLLPLVHNIDKNGKIKLYDSKSPCEQSSIKQNRLKTTIQRQWQRLNQQFGIQLYQNRQLRFCIVVNSFNNAKSGLLYRNLDSIFQQRYQNYHVVYTDDNSEDKTGEIVKKYIQDFTISNDKFKLKLNQAKVGMMENIYNSITYDCKQGQIVVMLDGDDSFVGTNVLSVLNAVYQRQGLAIMWSNFIKISYNSQASLGFSRGFTQRQKNARAFRQNLVSSHLKTFFVDLFRKIDINDLKDYDGKFYRGASDTAMMMPMIEMASSKMKYLPQILYQYRYDTGQVGNTVNRIPQLQALMKIYSSPSYEELNNFDFIDKAFMKLFR